MCIRDSPRWARPRAVAGKWNTPLVWQFALRRPPHLPQWPPAHPLGAVGVCCQGQWQRLPLGGMAEPRFLGSSVLDAAAGGSRIPAGSPRGTRGTRGIPLPTLPLAAV
eukprot:7281281-Prorocentrum_lima.AAC.1